MFHVFYEASKTYIIINIKTKLLKWRCTSEHARNINVKTERLRLAESKLVYLTQTTKPAVLSNDDQKAQLQRDYAEDLPDVVQSEIQAGLEGTGDAIPTKDKGSQDKHLCDPRYECL